MSYIGANIYYWGTQDQRRLMQDGLGSWVREVRESGAIKHFWYCPFDVRSPHVFALFRTRTGHADSFKRRLQEHIESYLKNMPSRTELSSVEIDTRHRECRITMNSADRLPGSSPNNSFELFEHAPDDYPFQMGRQLNHPEELWDRWDKTSVWALRYAAENGTRTAISWLASVDRALTKHGMVAKEYWRYHAFTLLPGLKQQFLSEPARVEAWLNEAVTPRNKSSFTKIWSIAGLPDVDIDGLVHFVAVQPGLTKDEKFYLLRQINHVTILQLGQIVRLEIPIVLYAWHRTVTDN